MKKKLKYLLMLPLLVLCACEEEGMEFASDDMPVSFVLDTRAEGESTTIPSVTDGTTFRIMAYGYTNGGVNNYQYLGDTKNGHQYGTGTYYQVSSDDVLIACAVDDNGTKGTEDPGYGIRGSLGNVWLSYVSPAVKHNSDGSFTFNPENKFLCSPAVTKSVNGYGTVNMGSVALQDMRAKVRINFYQGTQSAETVSINPLTASLKGAGDGNVKFYPASRQIVPVNEGARTLILTAASSTDDKGTLLCSTEAILPASIYLPKEKMIEANLPNADDKLTNTSIKTGNYLSIAYTMVQGGRTVDVMLLLTGVGTNPINELKPMSLYEFNVVVQSTHIGLTVQVHTPNGASAYDWEERLLSGGDATIEQIEEDITIGTWKIENGVCTNENPWADKPLDNPEI